MESLKCINSASKELMCRGFLASEWLRPPRALFISRSGNRARHCSFPLVLVFNCKRDNALCHYTFKPGPHISSALSYPFFSLRLSSQRCGSAVGLKWEVNTTIPSCTTHTGRASFFFGLTFMILWCLLNWTAVLVFALWTLHYSPFCSPPYF